MKVCRGLNPGQFSQITKSGKRKFDALDHSNLGAPAIFSLSIKFHFKFFLNLCYKMVFENVLLFIIAGLEAVDLWLPGPVKKLSFVSIWFSFCVALFLLNR